MFEQLDIGEQTTTRQEWEALLAAAGVRADPPYSAVYGIYENGQLVAAGARDQDRLKCVAVHPEHQGGPWFSQLLTGIIAHAFDLGIGKLYLYSKPEAVASFARVGFLPLVSTAEGITFMERGRPSFDEYLETCRLATAAYDPQYGRSKGPVESLVIDGDQFTAPEGDLVADAASHAKRVHLFVMGGEGAVDRLREHTGQLQGGICHPAQGYFIPSRLFPSYHMEDKNQGIRIQAALDALLLRDRIAPILGITGRTVFEDQADFLQILYNQSFAAFTSAALSLTRMAPGAL
ncbi:MAG: GNAT family N-acetyltransferase [Clostridiaceae bacterium]|nr:GNAT family N-acetyltransferase [Clostridiaceae bacterium]